MKQRFKKGDWLLRKWNSKNGGETDLVRFVKYVSDGEIRTDYWLRFKTKCENLMEEYEDFYDVEITDSRMSIQFKVATIPEIMKLVTNIYSLKQKT